MRVWCLLVQLSVGVNEGRLWLVRAGEMVLKTCIRVSAHEEATPIPVPTNKSVDVD